MTLYDWLLVRRTVALGVVLSLFGLVIMAATDEAASTLGGRMARFAAVAPIIGAVAAFLSLEQARARGEVRAFASAGKTPLRASLGALVGGFGIGAIGPALMLLPSADLTSLFPAAAPNGNAWVLNGGAWYDIGRGIAVHATGELERLVAGHEAKLGPSPMPRAATALSLGLAAVGCPVWSAVEGRAVHRAAVAAMVVLGAILAFHVVAAARSSPLWLSLPPFVLLVDAWILNERTRWI